MPNAFEPQLPECDDCGSTTGPFMPEPSGARFPSGAQKFLCSDIAACGRRLLAAGVLEAETVTPEVAYADAPDIVTEVGWVARSVQHLMTWLDNEDPAKQEARERARRFYYLRKAALLDRIALEPHPPADAVDLAELAARRVHRMHFPEAPAPAEECRVWVRCQYVQLDHDARHADGIPAV